MRCSKSCYLRDLELVDLFGNGVIEQVYYKKPPYDGFIRAEGLIPRRKRRGC